MVVKDPKISVLIIDNDKKSSARTIELLQSNPLVSAVELADNTDLALRKVISNAPDLVLLGYPSSGDSEKELIELVKTRLSETTLVVISTTKANAAFAIQNGIFNYLLTPIGQEDLDRIINGAYQSKQNQRNERINQIIDNAPEEVRFRLQTTKGYFMLNPDELIFCKASGFYTELYLVRDRIELSSQYLMKFEEILAPFNFLRVSRSHLINQKFIRKINKGDNTIVLSYSRKEYIIKVGKSQIRKMSNFENE
jgi:two-component system LytT family response regulator